MATPQVGEGSASRVWCNDFPAKLKSALPDFGFASSPLVEGDAVYVQAGGGVVYDSDPEAEYQETVNKSNALRRAAEDAGRFSGRRNS